MTLFSFGPIKTATALGGALIAFKDAGLADRVREVTGNGQPNRDGNLPSGFASTCCSLRWEPDFFYSIFVWFARTTGRDHDKIIYASLRGFGGSEFMSRIRHQPSIGLLRLLYRRVTDGAATRDIIARRVNSRSADNPGTECRTTR